MSCAPRDFHFRILEMFSELDAPQHTENPDAIRSILEQAVCALAESDQQIGIWEAHELNHARTSLESGFSKLALISVAKALAVHRLPPEEYAFGFSAIKTQKMQAGGSAAASADSGKHQKEVARNLAIQQNGIALKLKTSQMQAASDLSQEQRLTAMELRDSNKRTALELSGNQAHILKDLLLAESSENSRQHELESALSWLAGGYSIEYPSQIPYHSSAADLQNMQKIALGDLKLLQERSAAALKASQKKAAITLKEKQRLTAKYLKKEEFETASNLQEAHAIAALQKKCP